ncbi:twin-arginine translocase subunit TatC [Urbifossiella limnaea]|uniref:Sec-independent protein translocase protein TatC n=1 Tax=Urbifossiella limnaea TaxID=2528023 RepID=A0A517XY31_9BACT|nr:twin-arginine translocase subunit TatC [Urbifossiella limnaea]QDU22404.1 Sec-independent protein translocase protein TatCy [Urbifossiella limnaea]
MLSRKSQRSHEYPDDIFDDTRMTFGEHLEELRMRMIRALVGLVVLMCVGFVLDGIGSAVGNPKIGVGKPMFEIITDPVETQVRDFYYRRTLKAQEEKLKDKQTSAEDEVEGVRQKLRDNDNSLTVLTDDERRVLLGAPQEMPVMIPVEAFVPVFGAPKEGAPKEIITTLKVYPGYISSFSNQGDALVGAKGYLTTLSAQESLVVYFKVSIVCGIVLASPWLLYQFWAFVGAGMYPHEKRYIRIIFLPSLFLFVAGVLLCQFVVLPGAVKALLKFNEWLNIDPDIRLNEWLGLALILPLVFGLSFQTPLVMIFLNRIGLFSAADYLRKWRGACFVLALFAALITPTPDLVTMGYLFVPMFGLYLAGIVFCYYFPGFDPAAADEPAAEEIAV